MAGACVRLLSSTAIASVEHFDSAVADHMYQGRFIKPIRVTKQRFRASLTFRNLTSSQLSRSLELAPSVNFGNCRSTRSAGAGYQRHFI
jgi:hypothetical protein